MINKHQHFTEPIISSEQIKERVSEIAKKMNKDLEGTKPIFLGLLNGAFIFLSDLVRKIKLPLEVDFCRLTSYGVGTKSCGEITLVKDCELEIKNRVIVVIEDIVDTGLTIKWLTQHLQLRNPKKIIICSFINKLERRKITVKLDYIGFTIPKGFLVGYGLDYNQQYRSLPDLRELKFNK